jgi:hypothetical protein
MSKNFLYNSMIDITVFISVAYFLVKNGLIWQGLFLIPFPAPNIYIYTLFFPWAGGGDFIFGYVPPKY